MRFGDPDTSFLSRLLRGRLAAGRHPLTGQPGERAPRDTEQRSSAVIGALMRDTRQAYASPRRAPSCTPDNGAIQTTEQMQAQLSAETADPGDLSAFVLETLNQINWEDWISARCNLPAKGPFVISGSSRALDVIGDLLEQVFEDAAADGDDIIVHIYTGSEAGSARITVTGAFQLSIATLAMIKKSRRHLESISGALYTVRTLSSAGFEALIPER